MMTFANNITGDITGQRSAENVLQEQIHFLQALIDSIPAPVFYKDPAGVYTGCNMAFEEYLGMKKEQVVGRTVYDLAPKELAETYHIMDLALFREQKVQQYEASVLYSDKTRHDVIFHKAPFNKKDGTPGGLVGVILDITERKRMEEALKEREEKLHSLTQIAQDAIVVMDHEGNISFWNPAAEKIFGYSISEAVGRELHALLAPQRYYETYRKAFQNFRHLGNGNAVGKTLELDALRKGGEEFPIELSLSAIQIDGKWHAAGIIRDITGRRKSEERIRKLNEELELKVAQRTRQLLDAQEELVRKEQLSILGQLAGSVGHELRNPLGVMNNAIYFLKTVLPDPDERVSEYLHIIKSEIDNSERIISDLLDFSRTSPPRKQTVTIKELIHKCLGKCTVPDGVQVCIEIPETLPPVNVDPFQMCQVFQNLITNAIHAMPEGGALNISARLAGAGIRPAQEYEAYPQGTPPKDFIGIAVSDNGEGILPENMKKLFQPLFTTKTKGIGLGLVVSKRLTEANGGRIDVESRLSEGTIFTTILPVGEGN